MSYATYTNDYSALFIGGQLSLWRVMACYKSRPNRCVLDLLPPDASPDGFSICQISANSFSLPKFKSSEISFLTPARSQIFQISSSRRRGCFNGSGESRRRTGGQLQGRVSKIFTLVLFNGGFGGEQLLQLSGANLRNGRAAPGTRFAPLRRWRIPTGPTALEILGPTTRPSLP